MMPLVPHNLFVCVDHDAGTAGALGRAAADGQAARSVAGVGRAALPPGAAAECVRRCRQRVGLPSAVRHPDAREEVHTCFHRAVGWAVGRLGEEKASGNCLEILRGLQSAGCNMAVIVGNK